jgi:flagellar basal body-associated protein FliL
MTRREEDPHDRGDKSLFRVRSSALPWVTAAVVVALVFLAVFTLGFVLIVENHGDHLPTQAASSGNSTSAQQAAPSTPLYQIWDPIVLLLFTLAVLAGAVRVLRRQRKSLTRVSEKTPGSEAPQGPGADPGVRPPKEEDTLDHLL